MVVYSNVSVDIRTDSKRLLFPQITRRLALKSSSLTIQHFLERRMNATYGNELKSSFKLARVIISSISLLSMRVAIELRLIDSPFRSGAEALSLRYSSP